MLFCVRAYTFCPCSNLAGSFTLAFSYYAGLEGITYGKVFGIIACFLGAVCIGLSDTGGGHGHEQTVIGDTVALFAAMGYGMYTTMIRYQVSSSKIYPFYHLSFPSLVLHFIDIDVDIVCFSSFS
jgi:drug/metabolite transporter (DMT)-like permease